MTVVIKPFLQGLEEFASRLPPELLQSVMEEKTEFYIPLPFTIQKGPPRPIDRNDPVYQKLKSVANSEATCAKAVGELFCF